MRAVAIANRHPKLRLDRRSLTRAIHTLDAAHDTLGMSRSVLANEAELSLVFLSDEALAQLHADFLDDPTTTDVITFEADADHGSAGEICVSVDTAARYAKEHGRKFAEELTLYVIHGWLHLAGYDDLQPAKKRVMRRAEQRAMKLLEQRGALPKFALR